jgi:glycolate oxidase FAD binding subunit
VLHVRLDGSAPALDAVAPLVDGATVDADTAAQFWIDAREQRLDHFRATRGTLWRLHVPVVAPVAALEQCASFAFEWNGLQRWVAGLDAATAHALARTAGGHATCFRGASAGDEVFAPLPPAMLDLHRNVKRVFDPVGILNPGRLYAAL